MLIIGAACPKDGGTGARRLDYLALCGDDPQRAKSTGIIYELGVAQVASVEGAVL